MRMLNIIAEVQDTLSPSFKLREQTLFVFVFISEESLYCNSYTAF